MSEVKKEIELEIAHVLFIDIVGYSKLLINEQRRLLELLNQLVRGTEQVRSAEAAGRLIKIPTGDGMALVFYKSPEEPVESALEISRAVKEHPELKLRMGVHSGPVSGVVDVNERANVAGAGINIAQRIMDCGDAGHILLSRHVADDLEQYGHWHPHLHDLGECEVKHGVRVNVINLYTEELGNAEVPEKFARIKEQAITPEPATPAPVKNRMPVIAVTLALVLLLALGFWFLFLQSGGRSAASASFPAAVAPSAAVTSIPEKSIAVLPFDNLSSDKENAYFAEGIQDEILTRLSKIADVKVISRTSTQHYKSAPENLSEIGKQLGVAHVVEGSVQKSGDAVRVNVQLIKAANDSHLWAETFDRKITDLFSAETEIAKTIADQLGVKLTGREQQAIAAKPTEVPQAYDAYLRGLAYYLKPGNSPTNALGAQKHLREAVRLDPKFALAWALLAAVEASGYNTTVLERTPALREEAKQAADTTLKLQPNLGEAVYAQGYYYYGCLRDYDAATRYFEEARKLLPNDVRVPEALAYIARRRGDWKGSVAQFEQAERLSPRDVRTLTQHALSLGSLRRFGDALRKLDQVLDIAPDDVDAVTIKAEILQAQGNLAEAGSLLAPVQIPITKPASLETQFRQAVYEHDLATGVERLRRMLAPADPAAGYFIGELRFWLGWGQQLAGDTATAQQTLQQARNELEGFLKQQPQNTYIMGDLALVNMALGDKAAAFRYAEQGVAANPAEKDGVYGPGQVEVLARVAAQTREPDRALALLEKLLVTPYANWGGNVAITPALLRLDPMFDPLRNDPRFQKLCEEKEP